jgi:hypothetical protein
MVAPRTTTNSGPPAWLKIGLPAAAVVVVGVLVWRFALPSTGAPGPSPLPTAAAALLTATPVVAGVLFSDDLNDVAKGRLQKASTQPANFFLGYGSDGYVVQKLNPNLTQMVNVPIPLTEALGDAAIAVDARVVDPAPNRFAALTCRDQGPQANSGYRFSVMPATGRVELVRVDGGTETQLVAPVTAPSVVTGSESNRLELVCAGSTITGRVNGVQVASATDATYGPGALLIGAGAGAGGPLTVEARFRNLVATRQ